MACLLELGLLSQRTEGYPTPVLNATLAPDELAFSAQFYDMLMILGKSTAVARIVGAHEGLRHLEEAR